MAFKIPEKRQRILLLVNDLMNEYWNEVPQFRKPESELSKLVFLWNFDIIFSDKTKSK